LKKRWGFGKDPDQKEHDQNVGDQKENILAARGNHIDEEPNNYIFFAAVDDKGPQKGHPDEQQHGYRKYPNESHVKYVSGEDLNGVYCDHYTHCQHANDKADLLHHFKKPL